MSISNKGKYCLFLLLQQSSHLPYSQLRSRVHSRMVPNQSRYPPVCKSAHKSIPDQFDNQ